MLVARTKPLHSKLVTRVWMRVLSFRGPAAAQRAAFCNRSAAVVLHRPRRALGVAICEAPTRGSFARRRAHPPHIWGVLVAFALLRPTPAKRVTVIWGAVVEQCNKMACVSGERGGQVRQAALGYKGEPVEPQCRELARRLV